MLPPMILEVKDAVYFPPPARRAETRALEFPHFISLSQGGQPYVDDSGNGLQQIA